MLTLFESTADVRIQGTSSYLPDRVVTTEDLFAGASDVNVADLLRLTGVHARHVAAPEQATSDLAIAAARPLLTGGPISRLLLATVSPDHPSPATAPLVQHGLGLPPCPAMDLVAACAGYVYALDAAARFVATGDARVLVVAAETRVRSLADAAPGVRCLFGDGASAALVNLGSGPLRLLATYLDADGAGHKSVRVEAGGSRMPASVETLAKGLHSLRMDDGPNVFFSAVEGFIQIAKRLAAGTGVRLDDVDVFVPHQANARILDRVARELKVPLTRFVSIVERTGNTGGASVGIALDAAIRAGTIRAGHKVMLLTAGAGYTGGGALLSMGEG
jgi:3-oxoacyl-(acyl-carrier-protein) synthase III